MPKLKTKSGVKKRFKLTATGKIKHGVAGKRHRLISHNAKYIRQNRGTEVLADDPDDRCSGDRQDHGNARGRRGQEDADSDGLERDREDGRGLLAVLTEQSRGTMVDRSDPAGLAGWAENPCSEAGAAWHASASPLDGRRRQAIAAALVGQRGRSPYPGLRTMAANVISG